MKRTIRGNVAGLPYSLHDMHITELVASGDDLTFKFADGFEQNTVSGKRAKGDICFHGTDRDLCFVYVLDFCGNEGEFSGRKYTLDNFAAENREIDFEVIDETYGYDSSKFAGWLRGGEAPRECVMEICHMGAMEYLTEE